MKKIKNTKSLALTAETIRVLDDNSLKLAGGGRGAISESCNCDTRADARGPAPMTNDASCIIAI